VKVIAPELKTYYETKNLRVLAECLPLDTPFTVGIDPSNICNFRCVFCTTGHERLLEKFDIPKGIMDYPLFKKIIKDLKSFPQKVKRLYLYHEGEPLLNPWLPEMVAYAKKADVAESIQVTTNGTFLTQEMSRKLMKSGLDLIRISVDHINDNGYRKITKTFGNYELIRRNVEMLFEERERSGSHLQVHPKIIDTGLTTEELEKFRDDFLPISDHLNIQQLTGRPHSSLFDFTLDTHPTQGSEGAPLKPGRLVCAHPFYVMLVKYSGLVSACSEDWTWEAIIGDVRKENMIDIWNGERLRQIRLMQLRGNCKQIPFCSECPYPAGLAAENELDDCRERLISLYDVTQ
jgi:MoaA/NifB/PqqE/SkfB family radical SAM enzyme